MSPLTIQSKAPSFTLVDTEMNPHCIDDLLGKSKLILAFFPGAFTSTCTTEMCTLRDTLAKFNELGANVIGISVNDPFTNKAFKTQNQIGFPILSDYTRLVIRRYGLSDDDFAGLKGYTAAKRAVLIINQDQEIEYMWVAKNPGTEPPYEKIVAALSPK